jgi:D-amino peptidase
MKIYISCDIEGVAGIVDRQQGNPEGGAEYERGRRLMMAEVNAAIEGALDVGPAGSWSPRSTEGRGSFKDD